MAHAGLKWGADDVFAFLEREFPQAFHDDRVYEILSLAPEHMIMRLQPNPALVRPGGSYAGPALIEFVDIAAYVILLARHREEARMAVTTNLNISFLRRPDADKPVLCDLRLIKHGQTLSVVTAHLSEEGTDKLVCHAEATYFMGGAG